MPSSAVRRTCRETSAPRNDVNAHLAPGMILTPRSNTWTAHWRMRGSRNVARSLVEMLIPSTPGTTLATKGAHVASLYCQHFPYKLPGSRDRHQEPARAVDLIFSTVDSYAPNFRACVVCHSALSPMDLEEKLGLAGGDIFQGALKLEQCCGRRDRC